MIFKRFPIILAALSLSAGISAGESASESASKPPCVEMLTTAGTLTIELNAEKAPKTVANFLTHIDAEYYDGVIFHRVIPGFMAQGGGYDSNYQLKERLSSVINESRNGLSNLRSTIAMARTADPDSANSQFFINLADNSRLDGNEVKPGYTVFGQVVEGMETIDEIAKIPTGPAGPFRRDAPQGMVIIKQARRAPCTESAADQ